MPSAAVVADSTYVVFAGSIALAAFLFVHAPRMRRPVLGQLLGFAFFLDGAILVDFPFGPSPVGPFLVVVTGVLGAVLWPELRRVQFQSGSPTSGEPLALSWSALWIPAAAFAAVYLALGRYSLSSSFVTQWLAIATVVVAVIGRRHRSAAVAAALAAAADAAYVATASGRPAYLIAALIVIALSAIQLRGRVRFDPVQLIAVQLAVTLLFRWAYYLSSGAGLDPNTYAPDTVFTPFRAELPLLAMALAAIGLGITRTWRPALQRLGAEIPRWWQVAIALFLADAYVLLTVPVNVLTYRLMPGAYYAIVDVLHKTSAGLPYWAIVSYALLAGICEESLFRGAIQPRAGILLTAVLFAAIHIQYGLTPILALVFSAGLVYGLIRKYLNLTTAVIAHAATDTGGFLLSHHTTTKWLWLAIFFLVVAVNLAGLGRMRSQERVRVDEPVGERGEA